MWLVPSTASAAQIHVFSATFGSSGSGAGQLSSPQDVAVDNATGDIYVADSGNRRVDEFSSTGTFIAAWGDGVDATTSADICTAASGDTCQAGTSSSAPGGFESPTFIAVDNSGGASDGDVYVGDTGDHLVSKFDPNGNLITSWGDASSPADGQLSGASASGGPFTALAGITVDASGNLFVYDPNSDNWFKFSQAGSADPTTTVGRGSLPVGIGVDPTGSSFFYKVVGDGNVEEFSAAGSDVGTLGPDPAPAATTGFAVDGATGEVYADYGGTSIAHYVIDSSGNVTEADGSTCTLAPGSEGCQPDDSFGSGNLTGGAGVAVNSASGDVYVAEATAGQIDVFAQVVLPDVTSGAPSNVTPTSATLNGTVNPDGTTLLATDGCYFEYVDAADYNPSASDPYSAGERVQCSSTPSVSGPVSAAVSGLTSGVVYHFRLVAANPSGATDGADELFGPPSVDAQSSSGVGQTTASLSAKINPDGVDTSCEFQYVDEAGYNSTAPDPYSLGQTVACSPADLGSSTSDQTANASLAGLTAGTTYHWRTVATNGPGTSDGADHTYQTSPALTIDGTTVTDLTASSATLNTHINPLGTDTSCQFQYGPTQSYGTTVPCAPADLGSGSADVPASAQITGLSANIEYHWRVVATNAIGSVTSVDHTFVYPVAAGGPDMCPNAQFRTGLSASLPDCRAYEMVTPPDKNGGLVSPEHVPAVASDGSSVIGSSPTAFAGLATNVLFAPGSADYQFTRTAAGWVTTPLNPPLMTGTNVGIGGSIYIPSAAGVGVDHLTLRAADGSISDVGPVWPPSKGPIADFQFYSVAVAADPLKATVIQASSPNFFWPFDTTLHASFGADTDVGWSLYEYTGTGNTTPSLVGVSGGAGSTALISQCGTELGDGNLSNNSGFDGGVGFGSDDNAVSSDGSTVYFTAAGADDVSCAGTEPPADEIFARANGSQTVAISEPSAADCAACDTSAPRDAVFVGAAADGSKAFFTTSQPLLGSDTSTNLYMYDFDPPAGQPKVVRVSAGDGTGSGPADVDGITAISQDGSHVYFAAQGVLTTKLNEFGQSAEAGADNLYVYERDAQHPTGTIAFITLLCTTGDGVSGTAPDPGCKASFGADRSLLGTNGPVPAQSTPDGRYLVFVSNGDLTPDDTSTTGGDQVFRYDAETGSLVRISIGESGFNDNGNDAPLVPGTNFSVANAKIAEANPKLQPRGGALSRTMSDDGSRVFFTSPVGLTSRALNDVQIDPASGSELYAVNVYEWEQPGAGSCPASQSTGCVYLISDGRDTTSQETGRGSNVQLVGTDSSGNDVFFTTADQLLPQDTDTQVDWYDARVDGGFPAPSAPASCQGDACQGQPSPPPAAPVAASVSFSGPGNQTSASPRTAKLATVRITTKAVTGSRFTLSVKVPAKGRITITGADVSKATKVVAKAGIYKLTLKLTAKAQRTLQKKRRLKVAVRAAYKPSSGDSSAASVSIEMKA